MTEDRSEPLFGELGAIERQKAFWGRDDPDAGFDSHAFFHQLRASQQQCFRCPLELFIRCTRWSQLGRKVPGKGAKRRRKLSADEEDGSRW